MLGVTINTEGIGVEAARAEAERLESELQLPVLLPLQDGVERLLEGWFAASGRGPSGETS